MSGRNAFESPLLTLGQRVVHDLAHAASPRHDVLVIVQAAFSVTIESRHRLQHIFGRQAAIQPDGVDRDFVPEFFVHELDEFRRHDEVEADETLGWAVELGQVEADCFGQRAAGGAHGVGEQDRTAVDRASNFTAGQVRANDLVFVVGFAVHQQVVLAHAGRVQHFAESLEADQGGQDASADDVHGDDLGGRIHHSTIVEAVFASVLAHAGFDPAFGQGQFPVDHLLDEETVEPGGEVVHLGLHAVRMSQPGQPSERQRIGHQVDAVSIVMPQFATTVGDQGEGVSSVFHDVPRVVVRADDCSRRRLRV